MFKLSSVLSSLKTSWFGPPQETPPKVSLKDSQPPPVPFRGSINSSIEEPPHRPPIRPYRTKEQGLLHARQVTRLYNPQELQSVKQFIEQQQQDLKKPAHAQKALDHLKVMVADPAITAEQRCHIATFLSSMQDKRMRQVGAWAYKIILKDSQLTCHERLDTVDELCRMWQGEKGVMQVRVQVYLDVLNNPKEEIYTRMQIAQLLIEDKEVKDQAIKAVGLLFDEKGFFASVYLQMAEFILQKIQEESLHQKAFKRCGSIMNEENLSIYYRLFAVKLLLKSPNVQPQMRAQAVSVCASIARGLDVWGAHSVYAAGLILDYANEFSKARKLAFKVCQAVVATPQFNEFWRNSAQARLDTNKIPRTLTTERIFKKIEFRFLAGEE